MYVNETKFERNSSLEYYHILVLGKQNIPAKEVCYFIQPVVLFLDEVQSMTDQYKVFFRRGDCRNRGVCGILVSKLPFRRLTRGRIPADALKFIFFTFYSRPVKVISS